MAKHPTKWTLESLLDLEQASCRDTPVSQEVRDSVTSATRELAGAKARRVGLRIWLAETGDLTAGKKFTSALSLVGTGLMLLMLLVGISSAVGLLDREKGGINVTLFLAILVGGQWLILFFAMLAWCIRGKKEGGLSAIQNLLGRLTRRIAGSGNESWWNKIMDTGGTAHTAILWKLATMAQAAGVVFNLGILCGLAGLVLVKHVGFYWESTTDFAMHSALNQAAGILSAPWSAWWPQAVPTAAIIEKTRWLPGQSSGLAPGPTEWWQFLLMTIFVWCLVPRAILFLIAGFFGRKALASADFQGRHHRALWRKIVGTNLEESHEKPLDGVLVLDVGGSGILESDLRPFLLQKLRAHPANWKSIAVLDSGAENEATRSLANAPAGVVLLAEGWSLSPARMHALHQKIRTNAGPEVPIKFLIANVTGDKRPASVTPEERNEWIRFVDGLRDPSAEVYFFEAPYLGL